MGICGRDSELGVLVYGGKLREPCQRRSGRKSAPVLRSVLAAVGWQPQSSAACYRLYQLLFVVNEHMRLLNERI